MALLDDKIKETNERIAWLNGQIYQLSYDAAISANAYQVALAKGDGIGADLNRNGNIEQNKKIKEYQDELKTLNAPETGVLAQLLKQKQVQLDAQNKVVQEELTAQQKTEIELAKIAASGEQAKAEAANANKKVDNKLYWIIGGVAALVIIVVVIVVVKRK